MKNITKYCKILSKNLFRKKIRSEFSKTSA